VASDRLSGSEKRVLLLWVLVGLVGATFAYKYFFRAFPEASVDFRVSRREALRHAQSFVSGLGENISGYRSAIIFDVDENAKTYLERNLGLQQANQLMSSELNIWYWDVRFFRPQQEEEFRVRVSPAGNIVGYEHKIEEARAGATLDRATAQSRAQDFLANGLGINIKEWDFLPEEASSQKRTNRLDWSFTWEKHGFRAKDAWYRARVSLQGDRVGGAQKPGGPPPNGEYLQVPEAWMRDFARLRSGNDTLALVFTVPYFVLLGAAVWLGIRLTKEGKTKWRGAILLGVVVTVLMFLQGLNDWPHWGTNYDTNQSYETFLVTQLVRALLFGVLSAITITAVLPAAEPLYRASQRERLCLGKAFTLRGLRSKEFFTAAVVGLSLAAAHIGYVVAFYIIAQSRFGAWAPQELNFDNSVNTLFPWITGAAIGLLASTNEEFTFRLFAIPFFQRLTRSKWIAVIVPAFLWSFLHSNYPQEPAYIRGIEIGIFGVIAGLVMLRWGILSTLIWHYTVDASLVGLLLVRSNNLYFKISGIVVGAAAVAPLLFAGISYLTRGRFEPDEDLLNSAEPAPEISLEAAPAAFAGEGAARRYDSLSPATIAFLALCFVAGGILAWRLKPESIGDYLKLTTNARTAAARADEIMRGAGLAPDSYHRAVVFLNNTDPYVNEYLRERIGVARVNELYATRVPGALWFARYFRDSQREEYGVALRPDGAFHSMHHSVAEAAEGASLTKEEAIARAEKFLRDEKKMDLAQWTLVESQSEKRPHRIDHDLIWQEKTPIDANSIAATDAANHAYVRVNLHVRGDEVTGYRTFVKIPDEWTRRQKQLGIARVAVGWGIPALMWVGLGLTALILFLKNLRSEASRAVPWKRLLTPTALAVAGFGLGMAFGDSVGKILNAYDTSVPLKTHLLVSGIGIFLFVLLVLGGLALLFGVAWYYAKIVFGEERIPAWMGMPGAYYRDAFMIGLGGSAALIGLSTLLQTAAQHWPTVHRYMDASFGASFDAIVPAASIFGASLLHSLAFTGVVAFLASFVASQIRPAGLRLLLFVLGAVALVGSDWGNPADFAQQLLARGIFLLVVVVGIWRIMRFNVLGCFLVLLSTALVGAASELLKQPDRFYRLNGYALLAAAGLLVAWPLVAWRMRPTPAQL
jgi:Type II CAAX prenyl endopeptidase Rce1-like